MITLFYYSFSFRNSLNSYYNDPASIHSICEFRKGICVGITHYVTLILTLLKSHTLRVQICILYKSYLELITLNKLQYLNSDYMRAATMFTCTVLKLP